MTMDGYLRLGMLLENYFVILFSYQRIIDNFVAYLVLFSYE